MSPSLEAENAVEAEAEAGAVVEVASTMEEDTITDTAMDMASGTGTGTALAEASAEASVEDVVGSETGSETSWLAILSLVASTPFQGAKTL